MAHNRPVPRLATFYGIVIYMYRPDHPPPHFPAEYGEHIAQSELLHDPERIADPRLAWSCAGTQPLLSQPLREMPRRGSASLGPGQPELSSSPDVRREAGT